jgi:hypothetical protein
MGLVKPSAVLVVLFLTGLANGPSPAAADNKIQLKPGATRPGGTISVKPTDPLDAPQKVFVRLTGPSQLDDFPIDRAEVGRGRFRITLPKEMRQGRYDVEVVTEQGQVVAGGGHLKILATETPTITKILPHPTYATDGTYSFEVAGENFAYEAEDNLIKINDVAIVFEKKLTDRGRRLKSDSCEKKMPCLIGNRRSLQIFGVSLEKVSVYRPTHLTVQVDSLVSPEKALVLSWAQRRTPGLIAFGVLVVLSAVVFVMARQKAARYRPHEKGYTTLAYFFIEPETNTYSLSRLQLILWTAAAVIAYVYLAASQSLVQWRWELPDVPEGLPALLGVSVGTTALALGATEVRGSKGAGPLHPSLGDFVTNGGVLAPERLQFFVWTIIGVIGFVAATLAQDPATVAELPKVPSNFVPLMGVSALGYLAGKVVRKAGPIIKQLAPEPPYGPGAPAAGGIRIVGESLSPRAQVSINGELVPSNGVTVPPPQSATSEFVTELLATPPSIAPAAVRVPAVKVVNPDGQSAEM